MRKRRSKKKRKKRKRMKKRKRSGDEGVWLGVCFEEGEGWRWGGAVS